MYLTSIYKFLGPIIYLIFLILDPPLEMSNEGFHLLGIIIWMAIWWISEVIPIAITALLPIILFPSNNILNIQETGANYGHIYWGIYIRQCHSKMEFTQKDRPKYYFKHWW